MKKNEYHFEVYKYNISKENNNNKIYSFTLIMKNDSLKIYNLKQIKSMLDGYVVDTLSASLNKLKYDLNKKEIKIWVKTNKRIFNRKLVFPFPTIDSTTKFQGTESIDFHPRITF